MSKNNKNKLLGVVSFLVVAALLTGLVFSALDWWTDKGPSTWGKEEKAEETVYAGGMFLEDGNASEGPQTISFVTKALAASEYPEYGVMATAAESVQQITATVSPADAIDNELEWSIAWENGGSGKWGNGKTVTEYVSGSASDDTHTYTLTCHKGFGEVIIVKAQIKGNESVNATKKVQYQQKLKDERYQLNIAYTNSSAPEKNVTWELDNVTPYQNPETFPQADTAEEFKNYYSSTGSNKGTYQFTLIPNFETDYTVQATVGTVSITFQYIRLGNYLEMADIKNDNVESGQYHWTKNVASGNGTSFSDPDFDFVKALALTNMTTDLQYNNFRSQIKRINSSLSSFNASNCIALVSFDCVLNEQEHDFGNCILQFDAATLGTSASSIDLGTGDLTF